MENNWGRAAGEDPLGAWVDVRSKAVNDVAGIVKYIPTINASSERAKIADTKVEPWADGHSGANEERDLEEWQEERGSHGSTALNLDWRSGGFFIRDRVSTR